MATGNILAEGNVDRAKILSVDVNLASVAGGAVATQTVTLPGVLPTDFVAIMKPSNTAGLLIGGARCLTAGSIQITYGNPTGVAADPGNETYLILIVRTDSTLLSF